MGICVGYPGELIVEGPELAQRWSYWFFALIPFAYIVYELLVGLAAATAAETDPRVRDLVFRAQWVTVVNIQVGYCVSDVISKCGVGLIIYCITNAKSTLDKQQGQLA